MNEASDGRGIEAPTPSGLAEDRVRNQEVRVQVRVTRCALVLRKLHLAILDADLCPPRGVMREFQPGNVTRFRTVVAALPHPGLADALGDIADGIPSRFQVSIVDPRLRDRTRECPCDGDTLVRAG